MADYKLHCFAQSGNAYKVALALELAGANWEPIWVDFFKGQHKSEDFTSKNIMAEVPVLESYCQIWCLRCCGSCGDLVLV